MVKLRRKSVKRVFVFFLIYLPLQYLFIGISDVLWSEPWPSFALPGFKNIYTTEGQSRILKPFFYAEVENESREFVEISEVHLFDGIQPSQLQGFLRTHFSEPQKYSTEAKQWLQKLVKQQHPDINSTELKVVWKEIAYEPSGDSMLVNSEENIVEITISLDD